MKEENQKGEIFLTNPSGTASGVSVEIQPPIKTITEGEPGRRFSPSDIYSVHQSGRDFERLIVRIENLEKESKQNSDKLSEPQKDLMGFRWLRKGCEILWKNTSGRFVKI